MSIRLPSFSELSRLTSTQPRTNLGGWQNIPHINQLRPNGAGKDYANGAYNCGPAVVAMLARGHGNMSGISDAKLIQQLGKGLVTKDGVDADGIAKMLKRADVPPAGEALGADYDDSELNAHLDQGHKVIAQVRASDAKGVDPDNAHYVLIQGKTKDGNYNVSDPLAKKSYVVTPDQLREAVLKAPPDGGMLIPVASPAEAQRTSPTASTTTAPAPAAAQRAEAPAAPVDVFEGAEARALKPTITKAPNPDAFSVTQDVFEGVDTSFKEPETDERNEVMEANEQRNQFEINLRYGKSTDAQAEPSVAPVVAEDRDVNEAAAELRERKASGDKGAYETLAQLEKSTSDKDKAVLDQVKTADKKDPGIGKKSTGDAF
ncbi:cysteine peptidase family C39 domain-containing protein [Hyalangium minutum]|uniref:Peptidase C39 domain-containing protein n=1 Tax=Hyalangium minutum TaxID=394096 RepID=A0A085WS56_9BACT|nr:cysteine peptidase family C39 domain-containing protein [Hyalangium minutum]KFE70519.1 hypothetical protein DB31_5561 [Hyalangium minutum]